MNKNEFTISNIAGGDLRTFRMKDGDISDAAVRHADRIGFGGPKFGGPAGQEAADCYAALEKDRLYGYSARL